jgi:hypothetical protein
MVQKFIWVIAAILMPAIDTNAFYAPPDEKYLLMVIPVLRPWKSIA